MANARFREYVTDTAFNLTMKKSHISALHAIAESSYDIAYKMSIFVPAVHGLQRRGLIEFMNVDGSKSGSGLGECYRITAAGKLVYSLLIEAGLIEVNADKKVAA